MPARSHYLYSLNRLERAHQNRMRNIGDVAHGVELVVHAVNKIDIRHAARAVHRLSALRSPSSVRMRGPVFRSAISFNLNYLSRNAFAVWPRHDQKFTEQISSDGEDVRAQVKLARQFGGLSCQCSLQAITTKIINPIRTMPLRTHFWPMRIAMLAPK